MGLQVEVEPYFYPEENLSERVLDDTFYFLQDRVAKRLLGARSLSLYEGAAVHLVEDYDGDPQELTYRDARKLFTRQNKIDHILPWLTLALNSDVLPNYQAFVTIRHTADYIPINVPVQFPDVDASAE